MKLQTLALVFLLGVGVQPVRSQQVRRPLSRSQILDLMKFGMDSHEIAKKIMDNGIAFQLTDNDFLVLRSAGATPEVMQAVIASSADGQESGPPLSKKQLIRLARWGLSGAAMAARVQKRGVDFDGTQEDLAGLRNAGVPPGALEAIQQMKPQPLTRDQVGKLVAAGVPSERAVALVKQRGIDFPADEDYLQSLRLAAADDTVIQAVREASASVKGRPKVDNSPSAMSLVRVYTSPDAEITLDGLSLPQTTTLRTLRYGYIDIVGTVGEHTLKVTIPRWKDFEQSVKFLPRQIPEVEAWPEALPSPVKMNARDGLKYLLIPAGSFMMGCSRSDSMCRDEEKPPHPVTISKDFWLGQTPVTVGAYRHFVTGTRRRMPSHNHDDNAAVVEVKWDDASAYCAWVGGRLPTEAEWEFAARAGADNTRYAPVQEIAMSGGTELQEVAQMRPNGFGLYDMLGYVWQWVSDWFAPYAGPISRFQPGFSNLQLHLVRGGSRHDGANSARASAREIYAKPFATGFRCAAGPDGF